MPAGVLRSADSSSKLPLQSNWLRQLLTWPPFGLAAASSVAIVARVLDDGPGIPQPLREEVFKPFLRLDDARNQDEGGTGLGLAIARDIARSHGGDVQLAHSPLGGLRASVRIPV